MVAVPFQYHVGCFGCNFRLIVWCFACCYVGSKQLNVLVSPVPTPTKPVAEEMLLSWNVPFFILFCSRMFYPC